MIIERVKKGGKKGIKKEFKRRERRLNINVIHVNVEGDRRGRRGIKFRGEKMIGKKNK